VLALFVNPRSRANKRDPALAARLGEILKGEGRVLAPASLEELGAATKALCASAPTAIAVHGGDGTLHQVLTALVRAWDGRPLPPLALLGGGTMNVVAASLGIRASAPQYLESLVAGARAGRPPTTVKRRCLQVGDRFGFVFGNGFVSNFLGEYYAARRPGPMRVVWLLTRLFFSVLFRGPFARRVVVRFRGRVLVDGAALPFQSLSALSAATVREVGMGFKLNHRADDDPERFAVLAIHAGPLALFPDVIAVKTGRGVSPSRAYSAVASSLDIEPADPETSYTIDGDLYRTAGPLHIAVGPALDIVDPR
jgi:diacylglycerol kinase (ATP)